MGSEAGIKKSTSGITNHFVWKAGLASRGFYTILSHPHEITRNPLFYLNNLEAEIEEEANNLARKEC